MQILCKKYALMAIAAAIEMATLGAHAQTDPAPPPLRRNAFNDPFMAVTSAIAQCPVPEGPLYTEAQVRELAHVRSQHGGSCYRVGRCRLPNSYLYDAEIIPRVSQYIQVDGRFDDTSVWVLGERRLVTLMGCVQSEAQSQALEKAVWLVDDVMGVINLLSIGNTAFDAARYPVRKP